jgi:dolichol-phosphate mannosyltransferase
MSDPRRIQKAFPIVRVPLKRSTLDLTVVIPTVNEGANLEKLLPDLRAALDELKIQYEVLIVDGNSTDNTRDVVQANGAHYVLEERPGYGTAILRGVAEANGAFVLTMDADQSHPAGVAHGLWAVREKADITIASRYVPGGKADQPLGRLFLSRVLNVLFGKGLDINVRDLSSGYRLYRKTVFRRLDMDFTNFVLLIDILLKAHSLGFTVQEVPFHYRPRGSGSSKARIFKFGKDYLRLFRRVWKIRNSVSFPDYDWRAHNSRIWLQRYWQRTRYKIILRFTPPKVSTCDIGCGSSHILAAMPHAVGLDLRHDKLAFMRRTNRLLVQGDGMLLPFADGQFDCVITSEVIEHIPNENGRHIDEVTRILKPGGTLVIGTPDYDRWEWNVLEWLYKKVKPDAYGDEHVTFYTFKSLSEALRTRGYEILDHDYVGRGELIFKARKAPAG